MKKNHFNARKGIYSMALAAMGAMFLGSCADDGLSGDKWDNGVRNTTLQSPAVDDITVTASPDGTKTTIAWPVVYGAGGYICSVYNVNDPDNPEVVNGVKDSLVDGCSLAVPRAEETNYKFVIQTVGNAEQNNKDAETATEVAFNSYLPTYKVIPAGSDLYQWFQDNAIPETAFDEMVCYDLEAGAEYTLSQALDLGNAKVTLRSPVTNKTNHPKITFAGDASLVIGNVASIRDLDIDASASNSPVVLLNANPDERLNGALANSQYYNIDGSLLIDDCHIEGVNKNLIYDNNKKYCIGTCIIKNSIVHLTSSTETDISGNAIIYFKNGFINDLTVQNSTFYNTGNSDAKYFVQYNNSGRCDRGGYATNSINFMNNTFYNVVKAGQWGNYSGFAGRATSYWTMTDNIFVDCGNKQIARRFLGGRQNQTTATFGNNTYMFEGDFESAGGSVESYDNSGTAIEEDPQLADPANGDFTVNGATQKDRKTGDPRWLK